MPRRMQEEDLIWKQIWKTKGVVPRVKMFFWKAVQGALPMSAALSRRINQISAACKLCDHSSEDVNHALLHCHQARATWFSSCFGLRTSALMHLTFKESLAQLWGDLDETELAFFMSLTWHIWKARYTEMFGAKPCNPVSTIIITSTCSQNNLFLHGNPTQAAKWKGGARLGRTPGLPTTELYEENDWVCWVDGSFAPSNKGGTAFILERQGQLNKYGLEYKSNATSPFQMEATALLMGIQAATEMQLQHSVFRTDYEMLVRLFQPGTQMKMLQAADWRAYSQLVRTSRLLMLYPFYSCREENERAHQIANRARIMQFSYTGYTYPLDLCTKLTAFSISGRM